MNTDKNLQTVFLQDSNGDIYANDGDTDSNWKYVLKRTESVYIFTPEELASFIADKKVIKALLEISNLPQIKPHVLQSNSTDPYQYIVEGVKKAVAYIGRG